MKTSEIAAYIADKNVRLFIGAARPFLPLLPMIPSRTKQEVGWCAFNLVACAEAAEGDVQKLYFNEKLGAFGFFELVQADVEEIHLDGWERVQFDGFGGLESWKEVGI